jgi:hypothetical protein
MRTLKTIALVLIFYWGHANFVHSSIYPFEPDWYHPIADGVFIQSYDIGVEVIGYGDTPPVSITTIRRHEYGLLSNFSNSGRLLITHDSFLVDVTKGQISMDFFTDNGTLVTLAVEAGNSYEFEPRAFKISSSVTNNKRISVFFDGARFFVPPGESTQIVEIDILPVKKPNHLNQNAQGLIPVVIFGSTYLDVNNIEISSLNFESLAVKTGEGEYYLASVEQIDDDEYPDLIAIFETNNKFLYKGFRYATLRGILSDGTIISGKDNLYIAP